MNKELQDKWRLNIEDLEHMTDKVREDEQNSYHYLCVNRTIDENTDSLVLSARRIKVSAMDHVSGKGINKAEFDRIFLLHDGSKAGIKPRVSKKAAEAKTAE